MSMGQNKIARGAVWVIMGLVVVGLVGFGSFNFGGSGQSIGKVGETDISANRYFREVNAQLDAIEQQFGQRVPFAQAQVFGVDQQALSTVLAQVAMENETARLGISVGDEELAGRIRNIPSFAGVDGSFDRDAYEFVLEQSGLAASEFEESLRSEVARTILQGAVANGVAVQPSYVSTLYGWARETRDITWAVLDASTLDAPVGTPDEAQLSAFYEASPDAFTLPETKKITYGWIRPEDLSGEIEVSEEKLRKAYEERASEFRQPERRLVERLAFPDEAAAEDAAARLESGAVDFEDLVGERGLDLTDIDLGDVTEAELGSAGQTVFGLDGPGTTGVAASDFGPAIFRVNAVLAALETSFEDASDALRDELALDGARQALGDLMTDLDDALAGGATIDDLGQEFGVAVDTLDWTGLSFEGIAGYDEFAKTATEVTVDDYPTVEILPDGGLFALRLDEVVPATLQPLDDVREQAIAGWQAAETETQVKARAQAMLDEFAAGETPASLGLTQATETGILRDDQVAGAPPALSGAAFGLDPGGWTVIDADGGAIVLRLDAVNPADQESEDATQVKSSFADATARALSQDLQDAFAAALETQAGITLDQAMINAVNAQFQ